MKTDKKTAKLQIWDTGRCILFLCSLHVISILLQLARRGSGRSQVPTTGSTFPLNSICCVLRLLLPNNRGADGIIMVYDVCCMESFTHVNEWLLEVNRYASESTCKLLVGNKSDKEDERLVSYDTAKVCTFHCFTAIYFHYHLEMLR